jgi:hypothetical protein
MVRCWAGLSTIIGGSLYTVVSNAGGPPRKLHTRSQERDYYSTQATTGCLNSLCRWSTAFHSILALKEILNRVVEVGRQRVPRQPGYLLGEDLPLRAGRQVEW